MLPELFDGSDAGIEKDGDEIGQRHLFEGIRWADRGPVEEHGNASARRWIREILPKLGRYDRQFHEGRDVQLKQAVKLTLELV